MNIYLPICAIIFYSKIDHGKSQTITLCPVLGQKYPEIHRGDCPLGLQNPVGKKLQVSFSGTRPYVQLNPVGGTDVDVIDLLSKKFGFLPRFVPEFTNPPHDMIYKV